jgi:hypothetical protein
MVCCAMIDVLLHNVLFVVSVIFASLRLSSLDEFEVLVAADRDLGVGLVVVGPSAATTRAVFVEL